MKKRERITIMVCPRCGHEVYSSSVTYATVDAPIPPSDWMFCAKCRGGPWLIGTLGSKTVIVRETVPPPPEETPL